MVPPMADDKSKQDEDKVEFDSAGEAVGYISLDQARVLAIEHARDNRNFYGRRYRRRELVWEVISQQESEDYYDIKLAYRPAGRFRGEPGAEQFIIDKTGDIRVRQILEEPSELGQPGRRVPSLPIMAVVGLALIAIAGVGALWAAGRFGGGDPDDPVLTFETVSTSTPASAEVSPSALLLPASNEASATATVQTAPLPTEPTATPTIPTPEGASGAEPTLPPAFVGAWGSRGRADGQFVSPAGLAVDSDGIVHVADVDNNSVQVFEIDGRLRLKWGIEGS